MKKALVILLIGFGMILGKDVVMIIAHNGFNRTEYEVPKGIFETEGYTVATASSSLEEAVSMDGSLRVKPDILIDSLDVKNYDAIVFVGGSGAVEYWPDPISHSVCRDAISQGKVLSAICIAPVTLACSDVLVDKKATVFPTQACIESLTVHGAEYTGADVEEDGRIITANGPPSAQKFANTICSLLELDITLTTPNGGEVWYVGEEHEITWEWKGEIENVKLEYSINGGEIWEPIVESIANNGSYKWVIPDRPTTHARIRVSDATDLQMGDESDGDFTIAQTQGIEESEILIPSLHLPFQPLISLSIYDSQGRLVKTLNKGFYNQGVHTILWNVKLPSGIYFIRLETQRGSITKKLVVM